MAIPSVVLCHCGNLAPHTGLAPQADATLPVEQRRNYKGVGDALFRWAPWFLFIAVL